MKLKYLLRYTYITQRIDLINDENNEVIAVDYMNQETYDKWEVEGFVASGLDKLKIIIKRPLRKHKQLRRQLKTFSEQGDIGRQIAQGMLEKFVEKGIVTGEEAEKIAFDLKI